jgi:hypothetical protein
MRFLAIFCLALVTAVACSDDEQILNPRSNTAAGGALAFALVDAADCVNAVESAAAAGDGFKSAVKNVKSVIADDAERNAAIAQAGAALELVIGRFDQVQTGCAGGSGPDEQAFDPLNARWLIEPPLQARCDARPPIVPITVHAELSDFVLSTSGSDPVFLRVRATIPWAVLIFGFPAPGDFVLDDAFALPDALPDDPQDLVGRTFQGEWQGPPGSIDTILGPFVYQALIAYDLTIVSLAEIAGTLNLSVTGTVASQDFTCTTGSRSFTANADT